MGMVTNLVGGWIAARFGLTLKLYWGLGLQVIALLALSALNPSWPEIASVAFVLVVQGLSGVAKDLSKMSAQSAVKIVVPQGQHSAMFKWVAVLHGTKKAHKGYGVFRGGG